MKSIVSDTPFLYLVSLCLLLIMILLLLLGKNRGHKKAKFLLFIYFAVNFYLIGITYVFIYEKGILFPHTLRTGNIAALLMAPISYWYIKQSLFPSKFSWKDIFHLLPVIFYLFDMLAFFQLSGVEKETIYAQMDAVEYRIGFSQGKWMPTYGHIILRTIQMIVYWIAQTILLWKARKSSSHTLRLSAPASWRWLHVFLLTQIAFFLFPFLGSLLKNSQLETVIYSFAYTSVIGIQCFYLLLQPEVLNPIAFTERTMNNKELEHIFSSTDKVSKDKNQQVKKGDSVIKQTDDITTIEEALNKALTNNILLQHQYSLTQLADETKLSTHKLSAFINSHYQMNFNDFINRFRVKAVINKLESGESEIKTLAAIAKECGFKSRTTFIRAFKKETGIPPGEYMGKVYGNATKI